MKPTHTITWGLVVTPELALNQGFRSIFDRTANAGFFCKLHSNTQTTTHVDSGNRMEEQHGF
mgnify:CR=1 FL=1